MYLLKHSTCCSPYETTKKNNWFEKMFHNLSVPSLSEQCTSKQKTANNNHRKIYYNTLNSSATLYCKHSSVEVRSL